MHEDDCGVLFNDREILIKGSRLTFEVMSKWGLAVHAGHEDKKSKI